MREYHKAVSTLERGLRVEPENQDCINRIAEIEQLMSSKRQEDKMKNRRVDAMRQDVGMPEIRSILADPAMRKVLQDIAADPQSAFLVYENDPTIMQNLQRLMDVGLFYSPLFKG